MIIDTRIGQHHYSFDSTAGMDISIILDAAIEGPNCFYAPLFDASPLVSGDFIGDTRKGSPVNFYNVKINPHGNGTHTECVGHISQEIVTINDVLKDSLFWGKLVSVYPEKMDNGDKLITVQTLQPFIDAFRDETAIIIRTLPNPQEKQRWIYSGSNPTYFEPEAIALLVNAGIKHLLTDLPSVDREEDGGKLLAHKTFWNYPQEINRENTITEMVFVPDHIKDGNYLVQIQIPPFALDAAPSRVFLYENLD
ncbi:MAG: cyclase family protein [Saprospiraceae bacterium]